MKTALNLLATAAVGCLLTSAVQAAKPDPSPKKRTLTPLAVDVSVCETADVTVTGDCTSEWANIELNFTVTVTVETAADNPETAEYDPVTEVRSGSFEVEHTEELTKVLENVDEDAELECVGTTGSTSFTSEEYYEAVFAAVESLAGGLPVLDGDDVIDNVSAKAWTTSNSVLDSKPTEFAWSDADFCF